MRNKYNSDVLLIAMISVMTLWSSQVIGQGQSPLRETINLNADWKYSEDNTDDIARLTSNVTWESINLPHTWNQWDAVDNSPGYRRDASWYQKELEVEYRKDAQYMLYFEGANITTDVYVDGKPSGGHVGGYLGFHVDITSFIKKGQKHTISVRVDNSYNPDVIPSQKADFFIYGGITRDVWLEVLPSNYLQSVKISTPEVTEQLATTSLSLGIHHASKLTRRHEIISEVIDPVTDEVVASLNVNGKTFSNTETYPYTDIVNPKLWSPETPNLYKVITRILDGDNVVDEKIETIGYRWFRFEDYGAFYLNGERLLLRGTHRHEEHAGYGAAMPNQLHRRDIEQIKGMGANFLRLGHYPQDPEIYKACNELGIIVWDELPWCRGGMGEEAWQANTERLLKEQIHQNYNHPSIFFWSLGNEIYWLPDFENGDDVDRVNAYVKQLNDTAHRLDQTRMTAIRKYYAGSDIVDVFSPSIWSGWYAGVYTNYENTLSKNQATYPRFLHMEYGGSSHVGRHTEDPITGEGMKSDDDWAEVANQVNIENIAKTGDWTENYIVDLFDGYLGVMETQDNLSGTAQWAFKDFGTPLRPENAIPYLNQKGLVDRAGKPKDAYYVYKSYWSDDPFAYIESHTWTHRRGPEGKERNLSVYSNCESVELILNGQSLGEKERIVGEFPACGLNWDVLFTQGENALLAKGYIDGKLIAEDSMIVNYDFAQAGKADNIVLSHRRLDNGNYLIEAIMKDKDGARVLDYEEHLYFSRDGAGSLVKDYGTPTRSQVIQMANGYAAIELVPAETGKAIVEARNQDFKGSYLIIDFDKED